MADQSRRGPSQEAASAADDKAAPKTSKEALQSLQDFIGEWKGNGGPDKPKPGPAAAGRGPCSDISACIRESWLRGAALRHCCGTVCPMLRQPPVSGKLGVSFRRQWVRSPRN